MCPTIGAVTETEGTRPAFKSSLKKDFFLERVGPLQIQGNGGLQIVATPARLGPVRVFHLVHLGADDLFSKGTHCEDQSS